MSSTGSNNMKSGNDNEAGHYVVTAHRPGGTITSVKCSFLQPNSVDVVIAKSRRLEVRQLSKPGMTSTTTTATEANNAAADTSMDQSPTFSIVLSAPINGRITTLVPFRHPSSDTDYIFFITENKQYAVISYSPPTSSLSSSAGAASAKATGMMSAFSSSSSNHAHNLITHASGDLSDYGLAIRGNEPEHGPLVTIEPNHRCIALHLYEGYVTVLPIFQSYRYKRNQNRMNMNGNANINSTSYKSSTGRNNMSAASSLSASTPIGEGFAFIGPAFHCRIDERDVFSMEFLFLSNDKNQNNSNVSIQSHNIMPQLALLHQDSRGLQHVIAHSLDLSQRSLIAHGVAVNLSSTTNSSSSSSSSATSNNNKSKNSGNSLGRGGSSLPPPMHLRLKKSRVEGGSGIIIPVPPSPTIPNKPSASNTSGSGNGNGTNTGILRNHNMMACKMGGVLILGHRKITYHNTSENSTKMLSIPPCLFESYVQVVFPSSHDNNNGGMKDDSLAQSPVVIEDQTLRYLLGDDSGRIHILALVRDKQGNVTDLHMDTLGETNISSCLVYLDSGMFFLGSQYTDSQLIQVLDEPVEITPSSSTMFDDDLGNNALLHGKNVTYLSVVEEYVNLGPIVDFDLVPTTHCEVGGESNHHPLAAPQKRQSMAITASGAGKDGSIRMVSNGIGMSEHAAVELAGIKGMWNIRKSFSDLDDAFLIQSYVGETRILGVAVDIEDAGPDDFEDSSGAGGTLEEVEIPGIDAGSTTLFAGNIATGGSSSSSLMMQITETEVRIIDLSSANVVCSWSPSSMNETQATHNALITVAAANESGQIILALGGGILMYLRFVFDTAMKIEFLGQTKLDREISCLNLNPFDNGSWTDESMDIDNDSAMDIDEEMTSKRRNDALSSMVVAVGLWDDFYVRFLSLIENNALKEVDRVNIAPDADSQKGSENSLSQHWMARSLCFVTLKSTANTLASSDLQKLSSDNKVDMLLVGLGDGGLVSFVVNTNDSGGSSFLIHSRKEIGLGTRAINLVPFYNHTTDKGTCVLATGDRPTVIYLAGGGSGSNQIPKLCYSNINLESECEELEDGESFSRKRFERLVVNVATPFHSSVLFSASNSLDKNYSLCISDESTLRLGMIDDIQKLHVTTHKLGMAPKRVTHHESGRVVCVGCIDDGSGKVDSNMQSSASNKGNCIRFFDDTTFQEIDRIDLDPFEMILSMVSTQLKVHKMDTNTQMEGDSTKMKRNEQGEEEAIYQSFLVVGTAYLYPDEDEPSRGRILLINCDIRGGIGSNISGDNALSRKAVQVTEVQVSGGVYSICSFYDGSILATINAKTRLCKLVDGGPGNEGVFDLKIDSAGHRGHILSLIVKSMVNSDNHTSKRKQEQIAIVGDLARSISVIKHYPEYGTLEEVARDFNQNWVTAIEMLSHDIYLGAENFHNLFILRRNPDAASEEVRSRLDTIGLFNLGEMVNKFIAGSLVIPNNTSNTSTSAGVNSANEVVETHGRKTAINIGSQTLYGTIDGTIGSIIGLDAQSVAFLSSLERAMARVITPVGNLRHDDFRAFRGQRRQQGSRGFIDGDLIESFIDLDRKMMELVVKEMINENKWNINLSVQENFEQGPDEEMKPSEEKMRALTVSDVITMVEEISMLH